MIQRLDFKIVEFSKSARKIGVSHTRTFEETQEEAKRSEMGGRKAAGKMKSKAIKDNNANVEKTTLGDISELAALKSQMEAEENKEK